jgi:hypothetical protein
MNAEVSEERRRLLQVISDLDDLQIQKLTYYAESVISGKQVVSLDHISKLPVETVNMIAQYLPHRDFSSFSQTSAYISECLSSTWLSQGLETYSGIIVNGLSFQETVYSGVDPKKAFHQFEASWGFTQSPLCNCPKPYLLESAVPEGIASFTVPLNFGISSTCTCFLDFSAEVHFGIDVIRSVIGVVDSLDHLNCDRALSPNHWGLAFGPLSGIVSSQGRYFDRYNTFNTGPFIRDFLQTAMLDTVGIRVGIFFNQGEVSFYRLPEEKGEWECTGVVHKSTQKVLYPAVMFWQLSPAESVSFKLEGIHDLPPYPPHDNLEAQDLANWTEFDEGDLRNFQVDDFEENLGENFWEDENLELTTVRE